MIHYRLLCRFGQQDYVDELTVLMRKKTSPMELRGLGIALKVISCIPEMENSSLLASSARQSHTFLDVVVSGQTRSPASTSRFEIGIETLRNANSC